MARERDPADDEMVDFRVNVHAVTPKAALLSKLDEGKDQAVWFPKSTIVSTSTLRRDDEDVEVSIREWIAQKNGWL